MQSAQGAAPRSWIVLALGSGLGLLSLLLLPIEQLAPVKTNIPPLALRALAVIQPLLLTVMALWAGNRLAPRLGLGTPLIDAVLTGGRPGPVLRRQLPAAITAGVGVGLLLIGWSRWLWPHLATDSDVAQRLAGFTMPLATRLLYGGIVEEVLTRWGLMTALVYGLWRLSGRHAPPRPGHFRAGILLAALLFGAGHLPLLFALNPHPPSWAVPAVIIGNALPGMVFGWLFWRRGLEAAILAHALAHVVAVLGS
jgi:hypothetical protein